MLQGTREEAFNAAVRRHLKQSGIPVENSKGEWGQGQHELNVRYADVLDMADRHAIYKQCLKEVADQSGHQRHLHGEVGGRRGRLKQPHPSQPVARREGETLCRRPAARPDQGLGHLPLVPRRLAGPRARVDGLLRADHQLLQALPGGRPGRPTRIAWSHDNRTAGFRVVGRGTRACASSRASPGADVNPYLAYAAALASGLDGIENQIEPPPVFEGDVYQAQRCRACRTACGRRSTCSPTSAFARATFGEEVVEHYAHFFRTEQAAFDEAVTDWERRRYFERI